MARTVSKDDYFSVAMDLLAQLGHPGLRQATVCQALEVTTGSFYRHFTNWDDFTGQLLDQWLEQRTLRLVELADGEPDPMRRLQQLRVDAVNLPHRAEAAIRAWSMVDERVRHWQSRVDQNRFEVVETAMRQLFSDAKEAARYARNGLYILVGFEQLDLSPDLDDLDWAFRTFLENVEAHRDIR